MDYNQLIRYWLDNFIKDNNRLVQLIVKYRELEKNIPGGPVVYDKDKLSPTHTINSVVESNAIMLAEISYEIDRIRYRLGFLMDEIDKLSEIEQKVIRYKYIEGINGAYPTWKEISDKVGKSDRQCRSIRDKAIEKMERNI